MAGATRREQLDSEGLESMVRPQRGLRAVHGLSRPHPPVGRQPPAPLRVGARLGAGHRPRYV